MIESISVSKKNSGVQFPEAEQTRQYVSMRGKDYERTPDSDKFESGNKKSSKVGLVSGLIAAAAVIVGSICLKKGGKVLEGKNASIKEKFSTGWKELFGSSKSEAGKAVKEAEEKAAKEAEEKAAKEVEERAKIEAEVRAKIEAENKAKAEAEEKAKLEAKAKAQQEAEQRELRAEQWRKNSQKYVDNIEKQLSGNISVSVNDLSQTTRTQILSDAKASTNKLANHARKLERKATQDLIDSKLNYKEIKNLDALNEYRQLVMEQGTPKQKELFEKMEIKLKAQEEMKQNTDAIVEKLEKRLDGSGYVKHVKRSVPKKTTKARHKQAQERYNTEFARELESQEMQKVAKQKVNELEQKLNGNISVSVNKPTRAEHNRTQAYYDSLSKEIARKNEQFELKELEKENESLRAQLKKLQNEKEKDNSVS